MSILIILATYLLTISCKKQTECSPICKKNSCENLKGQTINVHSKCRLCDSDDECNPKADDYYNCVSLCRNHDCKELEEVGANIQSCYDCSLKEHKCNKETGAKKPSVGNKFGNFLSSHL
ncbi:hypothetical protein MHBO_000146 [Bonamia ostreae]|uniref:Uncharacterized protein n=1 Tax=Bonamia ostreae TaxID=126728 RepID=A0ABV2AEL4_9EUKA